MKRHSSNVSSRTYSSTKCHNSSCPAVLLNLLCVVNVQLTNSAPPLTLIVDPGAETKVESIAIRFPMRIQTPLPCEPRE